MEIHVHPAPREPHGSHFWSLLDAVLPLAGDAVDLGTGTGRVALRVAPQVRRVVGLDSDAAPLEAARHDAARDGIPNASFVHADAESDDLARFATHGLFVLATARRFFFPELPRRVAPVLAPGGHLIVEAFESSHWREAGGSRFNVDARQTVEAMRRAGLDVGHACVERAVDPLPDESAARTLLEGHGLWDRWRGDGRWDTLRRRLQTGPSTLTRSRLVAWARRPTAQV